MANLKISEGIWEDLGASVGICGQLETSGNIKEHLGTSATIWGKYLAASRNILKRLGKLKHACGNIDFWNLQKFANKTRLMKTNVSFWFPRISQGLYKYSKGLWGALCCLMSQRSMERSSDPERNVSSNEWALVTRPHAWTLPLQSKCVDF